MEGQWHDDEVVVNGDARQQLYDTRGFGRPRSGSSIALTPVEAAYLLFTGGLDSVDGAEFAPFFMEMDRTTSRGTALFHTYADLRSRGYYLSPARDGWVDRVDDTCDFVVYSRGTGPQENRVAFRVRVVSEEAALAGGELGDVVLSIVDDESEVTYLETTEVTVEGSSTFSPPRITAHHLGDKVIVLEPPESMYHDGFYGQPIEEGGHGELLQLSIVEAAYLDETGVLTLEDQSNQSVVEYGRAVEGSNFDRRLTVYSALRSAGVVPKTGLKFGADFRTYTDFSTVEDLGHSEHLVYVFSESHSFTPRELALGVRLAHGVRKRTLFALTDGTNGMNWLSVSRLTP